MSLSVSHDDVAKTHAMQRRLFMERLDTHWTDTGMYRPGYSERETQAIDMIAAEAAEIGMDMVEDVAGNVFFIYPGQDRTKPVNMIGSHLDAVPDGGRYDGPAGVVGGMAAIRAIHESGQKPAQDTVLAVWRNEESPWFKQWGLGSAIAFGLPEGSKLNNVMRKKTDDEPEVSLADQMEKLGLKVDLIKDYMVAGKPTIPLELIGSLSEIHIKQDPELGDKDLSIGLATAIRGNVRFPGDASFRFEGNDAIERGLEFISQTEEALDDIRGDHDAVYTYPIAKGEGKAPAGALDGVITFIGEANHSGSTPQDNRKDAVRAGALFRQILMSRLHGQPLQGDVSVTFTKAFTPDSASATTIPAEFNVGLQINITDEDDRLAVQRILQDAIANGAKRRGCDVEIRGDHLFSTIIQNGGSVGDIQTSFTVTPETRSTEGAVLYTAQKLYTMTAQHLEAQYDGQSIVRSAPSNMSAAAIEKCMEFARDAEIACDAVVSGAGHDVGRAASANKLHAACDIEPTLIFLRHHDGHGVSHNPAEMLGRHKDDDPFRMQSDFHNSILVAANLLAQDNGKDGADSEGASFSDQIKMLGGRTYQPKLVA